MCWSKLEKKVNKLKLFHEELREHIEVRKTVLHELGGNYTIVATEIEKKADELIGKIVEIKNQIIKKIDNEKDERENELKNQLITMSNLLSPIKLNLLSSTVICSVASRIDFLHCYGDIIKGIKSILSTNLQRITFSSEILTDYQEEFMKLIEKSFGWNTVLMQPPPPPPKLIHQTIATISPVVQIKSTYDIIKSRSTSPLGSYANYIPNCKR